MRRAARVDANLSEVVKAFRKLGCSVNVRNDDMADLDVGFGGISIIVEVKDGKKSPSRRKLTPNQLKKRETWTGGIRLVENVDGAIETAALLAKWKRKLSLADGEFWADITQVDSAFEEQIETYSGKRRYRKRASRIGSRELRGAGQWLDGPAPKRKSA